MMRRSLAIVLLKLAGCGPDAGAAREALASTDPAERERAATTLKAMYAKDPTSVGDHGEAYWTARIANVKGKTAPVAREILGGASFSGGEAGGGRETIHADLDDFWVASLGRSTRGDDIGGGASLTSMSSVPRLRTSRQW